uniref:non-specific serine/threonine protein kinase n=1 Tax=Globodera rostochiensis TaxID=31243 RepID=A0A914I648_GLORO
MQGSANNKINGNFFSDPNCIDKCFQFHEELGSGGFGKVKLATHILTNEKVAIKIIDKRAIGRDLPRVTAELEALKQLAHQHICRMFQYVETEDKFYVVMEYCNGGEMFDYIVKKERLTEPEARHFFRQLVQAIAYIHSMGFAHRDLKPENLLLTHEQQLKVIDFGLCARPLKGLGAVLETCCGSPAYAAPELIQNNCYFGNEADIWSMGVLLYTLLCGCLPFDDDNYPRLYQKIKRGFYLEPDYLSSDTKEFLRCMLTVDPKQRATIKQILAHPWLNKSYRQQIKWQSIYNRDLVDEDVCYELALFYDCKLEEVMTRIKQWKFDYFTANYLILLQKKERKQNIELLSHKRQPSALTIHGSLEHDLNMSGIGDFSSDSSSQNDDLSITPTEKKMEALSLCPSQIFAVSPQKKIPRQNLNDGQPITSSSLELEKPVKKHVSIYVNDKENERPQPTTPRIRNYFPTTGPPLPGGKCGGDETPRPKSIYITPRRAVPAVICSPSAHRRPNSVDRPSRTAAGVQKQHLIGQQQQRSNSTDRPPSLMPSLLLGLSSPIAEPQQQRRMARFDTRDELKSPGRLRQRMFSSLERKKEKIVNFLTPRKERLDAPMKLKCTKTMVNVSVTSSTDPAKVRDELVNVLRKHEMIPQQNGWKIFGSRKNVAGGGQTTVELEVVAIENMGYVGVKRKRIQGDAFTYKKICEEVLRMAGL